MAGLQRASLYLERLLVAVCITLMVTLATVVVAAVIYRRLGRSLTWYDEFASVLLAWISYYGAALAALKRAHLGFPNLVASLPPGPRVALLIVGDALILFFFALVAYFGWEVMIFLGADRLISVPWLREDVAHSVIPIGALLFMIAHSLTFPDRLKEALEGRRVVEGEHAMEEARR